MALNLNSMQKTYNALSNPLVFVNSFHHITCIDTNDSQDWMMIGNEENLTILNNSGDYWISFKTIEQIDNFIKQLEKYKKILNN